MIQTNKTTILVSPSGVDITGFAPEELVAEAGRRAEAEKADGNKD